MRYQKTTPYLILLATFLLLGTLSSFSQDTFGDNFSSVSYTQNNGNQDFDNNWSENSDGGGATGGRIRVVDNRLRLLRISQGSTNRSISRALDLSSYTNVEVVLTLDYDQDVGNETVAIQLRNDSGGWDNPITTGTGTGTLTHTLTAAQKHVNSEIRFISGSGVWNGGEIVFIDNVVFTTTGFTIANGETVTTCSGTFWDTGKLTGQYSSNETITYTICPDTAGDVIQMNFITPSFDVEAPNLPSIWDDLSIFEGTTTATLIGQFYNGNAPGVITSTDGSGCLTFVFSSDGSITEDGWEATISCITPSSPEIVINNVSEDEDAGTIDFTVSLSGGNTGGSFTVNYATANGTASAGTDYDAVTSGTVSFTGVSPQTRTISIPITDDNEAENAQTFFVNLTGVSDPAVTIADNQGQGTINASDAASIIINDIDVDEDGTNAILTVTLSGGSLPSGFTVDYDTLDNTANAGSDYTGTGAPSPDLTFLGTIDEEQTISIPITDDTDIEGTQTFFVDLSNVSNALVSIADARGVVSIIDNDAGIAIDNQSVNESAGTITFTVTHTGADVPGGFSVNYSTANNTATAPSDYAATTSGTLNFSGTTPRTQTITINITNDTNVETSTETFFVNLNSVSSTAVTITDNQGLGTITDNDTASITIDNVSVNETSGTAIFTVTLTGGDIPGGFTVDYNTTATPTTPANDPADYIGTGSPTPELTFSGNGTTNEEQTISITIINDTDAEGDETYFVNLSNISTSLVTISDNQGLGTIVDDEVPIEITDGNTATCSAIFQDSNDGVDAPGNYEDNEDFTYTICPDSPGTFISANFTSFDVETANSSTFFYDVLKIYNGNSTTDALIGNFDNFNIPGTIISTNANGCLTFNFDSDGSVTRSGWEAVISCTNNIVLAESIAVNEDAGTIDVSVTYFGPDTSPFTIDYTTTPNSAVEYSDYGPVSGTFNFDGTTNQALTVTIPITDNDYIEPNELFYLTLSNISDTSINYSSGTITILDDADPAIPNEVPLTLFDEFNGYYDYALTAGSLRTSDNATDACATTSASSNTLTTQIPVGSTIDKAYLIWAHSGTTPDDVVTFEGETVFADIVYSSNALAQYYSMRADVTSIIASLGNPSTETYNFSDLDVTVTGYCGTIVLGGWSLMIFYTNPTLPAVSINFYDGFNGQQNTTTSYTLDGFFAIGSSGSKTSVLSWEGDIDFNNGETVTLTTGSGTTTLNGDGDNTGATQNVFNSTIYDNTTAPITNDSSQYGLDLDTFDISSLIAQGETSATTNVNIGGDIVLLNSVLLKVPSNLVVGTIFEDVNYGGGAGRDQAVSSGIGLANTRVELYNNSGNLEDFDITDANGDYNIGGMANGSYNLRVVNNTIRSNRGGGVPCGSCIPVQTYRSSYAGGGVPITTVTNEVGGADPSAEDTPSGTSGSPQLTGAQSVSAITVLNEGIVGIDFGFTYNAIVNTNEDGQGSLDRFIINSNQLDATGLDIEANSIFDPAPGEEVSIFMIPPTGDPLGRPADPNYTGGIFDINISNGNDLTIIYGANTHIDGRTQTAYAGDSNPGTIGAGGTAVGTTGTILPNYELPEIQVHQNDGNVFRSQGTDAVIRNLAIYADTNSAITSNLGSLTIKANLLGVNASGVSSGNILRGVQLTGSVDADIDGNYITANIQRGIYVNGGNSTTIQNNHITENGATACNENIRLQNGTGITVQHNLIENAQAAGIDGYNISGNVSILGNTVRESGKNGNLCGSIFENMGVRLTGSNSIIRNNIINNNGGPGLVISGTNSGNLISQNSFYANGTRADALGIDLESTLGSVDGNGVTRNDSGDGDNGANGYLNFPVFETANIRNGLLRVTGWARPGATIELFLSDTNQGTAMAGDNQLGLVQDYGEGQTFLASAVEGSPSDLDSSSSAYSDVDGNADTTNRFSFSIPLTSVVPVAGNQITATATLSNTTSEFANTFPLAIPNLITNRRITYRVTPSVINYGITGTLTPDLTADNFQDGNNGAPFHIIMRNTTTTSIAAYKVLVKNVPYAIIPGLVLGNHTLNTIANGNGTYNHIFTSTAALGGSASRTISGGIPTPAGIGTSCGCITFYKN